MKRYYAGFLLCAAAIGLLIGCHPTPEPAAQQAGGIAAPHAANPAPDTLNGLPMSGTTGQRPGNAGTGHPYFDTTVAREIFYNGSGWYDPSGGGGTPGGSNGDIQTNNGSGAFGALTPGTGVSTFLATPSGANLASALTTALPTTKGGTGLTAFAAGTAYIAPNKVIVYHSDGTTTAYANIQALLTHILDGDVIRLPAGTHDLGANGLDLSIGGTGTASIIGAGKNTTTLTSSLDGVSAPTASIIHPGLNGTTIADLTITANGTAANFAIPIGNVATTEGGFLNLQIRNVIVNGHSDAILTHGSGNTNSIFAQNSEFYSGFDTYQSSGTTTETFINCIFQVTAPQTGGGNNLARTILTAGTANGLFIGCRFVVVNTGSGNNIGVQASTGHTITMQNCVVDESGATGGGTVSDLKTVGTGTISHLGCTFNPNNISGTGVSALKQYGPAILLPSVVADLGGTNLADATHYVHTGGVGTATLPPGAGGIYIQVKNAGSGNLTIQRAGADTIFTTSAGQTSVVVAAGGTTRFYWDATTPQWVTE